MKACPRAAAGAVVVAVLSAGGVPAPAAETRAYDVIVYGGTAAGVITAVAAARDGARVALLEPRDHIGGMVSGGLGYTDHGRRTVIGGYSLEYYERAGRKYGVPVQWQLEPHVAEGLFQDMVKEAGVEVFYRHRLREGEGVTKEGARIASIALENGSRFAAKVFADATYEGDLMAQAGVAYTWGREGTEQYAESLAGVREKTPYHQFEVPIPARDGKGRPWPEVAAEKRAAPGSGDKKVQAYNFRVCMTSVADNRVAFSRPARYDARRFALLAEMLSRTDAVKKAAAAAGETAAPDTRDPKVRLKQPWSLRDVMAPGLLPNGKTDTNNNGAFSTDYIGASYDYPNGSYKARERIWKAHADYVQGFLYFLQNDPQVPAGLHEVMAPWGLCQDEFVDSGNWPHQLYVREGRRMIGEYVMSQKDIQTDITKPDVIGMGSYASDSHNVQRIVGAGGVVENEGDMQVPVTPYQIPYRLMLPRRTEATNLLVPVCISASHVAYSTLRMEPQYMIIGHAAGVAARMAAAKGIAVQDVDTAALTARLRAQRAVMEQSLVPNPSAAPAAVLPGGPGKTKLFLLIGQSNMAGRGAIEEQDKVVHPRVFVQKKDLSWGPAIDPLHFDKPNLAGVGLGSTFGRVVADTHPEATVGLVPAAFGGTTLDQWRPDGELYTNAVTRTREAMKSGTLAGILWHQGEGDSADDLPRAYTDKFKAMVDRLRSDLGAPDVPVVVGDLGQFRTIKSDINAVLAELPRHVRRCAFVSSEGLTDKGDGVHFDSRSLRELGRRYAAAWMALAAPGAAASPSAVLLGRRVRWVVETSGQPGPRPIEALVPDSWREGERLPVVYVLPVEKEDERRFGGGLDEVARLGLQNRHRVIAVAPTFAQAPWYGDHPKDPAVQQERYVVEDVVPSVDGHLPTRAGAESRFLVGFSKSGWGAFTLVLRHPETFGGAAAWDAPLLMATLGRWETREIFGRQDAFDRFRVDRLLRERGAAVGARRRLVLLGHGRFADDVHGAHALMQSLAVRHQYRDGPAREHRWDSGWLEEAFALLLDGRAS